MSEWYLLLTPLAVLAVLLLFRFAGCGTILALDDVTFGPGYPGQVAGDSPKGHWRLREASGTVAKNEVGGSPDGTYGKVSSSLPDIPAPHRSPAANPVKLELGLAQQPLLVQTDAASTSVRVQGGFVRVPFDANLNPASFTLEALVFPEWGLNDRGRYYCVLESSGPLASEPGGAKKLGFAIYAGPDDPNDPNSKYHWQLWAGTGTEFKRMGHAPNPATEVFRRPTYIGATFDGTKAFLFLFFPEKDIDQAKVELNAFPYKPAVSGDLLIGITDVNRALFPPLPGPNQMLYPFSGRIGEVAIYDKALGEERIASHVVAALTEDLKYPDEVKKESPEGYWRLVEETGTTADDATGSRDGTYDKAAAPLPEGTAAHRSPAAGPIKLDLGQPTLLDLFPPVAASFPAKSVRVQGGFVKIVSSGPLNPPEFTLEALALPEWGLNARGKYFCVIESSIPGTATPAATKKFGYALYAGPDNPSDPNSPYQWQLWVGTGTAFVRLAEKKPYVDSPKNTGPSVRTEPTYLAVTYTPAKAFLYVYTAGRHFGHVRYELTVTPYKAALATNLDLFAGITGERRALFAPFPGPARLLYPFSGRLEEVAVYSKALPEDRILAHATAAFRT
ncbi:MAG: hypothetical protein KIT09_17065 [Bryobacteraceae bacterium]|nr:hypothetical protein [Bryobacteraceae bacterium]